MAQIPYVTGNPVKVRVANEVGAGFSLTFKSTDVNIHEIQAADGEPVARDKAQKAYDVLQQPLVVSDDTWTIPALKGFPGPYMKYMNDWLTPQDWLNLTQKLKNRTIVLSQIVVYQDAHGQQLFLTQVEGMLLTETHGDSPFTHLTITSFDNGKRSVAEVAADDKSAIFESNHRTSWHDFAEWYTKTHAN